MKVNTLLSGPGAPGEVGAVGEDQDLGVVDGKTMDGLVLHPNILNTLASPARVAVGLENQVKVEVDLGNQARAEVDQEKAENRVLDLEI